MDRRTRAGLGLLFVATVAVAVYDWQRARAHLVWVTDEATAFERARTEHKAVFAVFTARWSVPCQRLERTFDDPEVSAAIAEDFIPLKIDVSDETEATQALQRRFGAPSLPAVRLMSRDGRVFASSTSSAPRRGILRAGTASDSMALASAA